MKGKKRFGRHCSIFDSMYLLSTMNFQERFERTTKDYPKIEIPLDGLSISHVEIDGSGKRRWVRLWHEDGGCHSIILMGGVIEMFADGKPEIRSVVADDIEWSTTYSGEKFKLEKLQMWVYGDSPDDVVKSFSGGVCRPIGGHHHRMWANAFSSAEWVRLWISA